MSARLWIGSGLYFLALAIALWASMEAIRPAPARCAYCFVVPCMNHQQCGPQGCACLKESGQALGRCVSLN